MIVTLISLVLINFSPIKCIDFLVNQKIDEAYTLYLSLNKSSNDEETRFLNAYFSRNVDDVIKTYEDLYLNTKNSKIKYLATKKLYEYYYAKGLYIKAQNLKSSLNIATNVTTINSDKIETSKYSIQCGVFGLESNALALKEKIATLVKNEVYLTKDIINEQEVIRVFIGNVNSYQQAESIKKVVDSKLSLNAMIKELEE